MVNIPDLEHHKSRDCGKYMKHPGFGHFASWPSNVIGAVIITLVLLAGFFHARPRSIASGDEDSLNLAQADLPPKGNPKLDTALNGLIADTAGQGPGPGIMITDDTSPPETMEGSADEKDTIDVNIDAGIR
jgi:hypothetical protein